MILNKVIGCYVVDYCKEKYMYFVNFFLYYSICIIVKVFNSDFN